MTIGEFTNSVEGFKDAIERQEKQADRLNHILGQYIGVAVNDPKRYPKQPSLSKEEKAIELRSSDDYERIARMRYGKK